MTKFTDENGRVWEDVYVGDNNGREGVLIKPLKDTPEKQSYYLMFNRSSRGENFGIDKILDLTKETATLYAEALEELNNYITVNDKSSWGALEYAIDKARDSYRSQG